MSMQWFWLASLVIFIVLEAATSALVSLWFVAGSMSALFAAICGAREWLQIVVFITVSSCLLFALRPWAKKYLVPNKTVTNARSNIGREAVVTETVDNLHGTGAVKIAGVFWSARAVGDGKIEEGTVVRIVEIQGAKVCVESTEKKGEVTV